MCVVHVLCLARSRLRSHVRVTSQSPLSGHDGLQMADRSTAINLASDGDDDDDFGHDSDHNDGGMGRGTQLDVSYVVPTCCAGRCPTR